jgi:hypothetical protein
MARLELLLFFGLKVFLEIKIHLRRGGGKGKEERVSHGREEMLCYTTDREERMGKERGGEERRSPPCRASNLLIRKLFVMLR